jgi:maleate isomerase
MYGERGRMGVVIPANNSVIEPEIWSRLPRGVSMFSTRILAKGDLVPEAVHRMEVHFDRAVEELNATGIDVLVYADMVTTFIMEPDWNERRTTEVTKATGVKCFSAWMALQTAIQSLNVKSIVLGTPYPKPVHALCRPFFAKLGYRVVSDATLDILAMTDVPKVRGEALRRFALDLPRKGAEAIVLLATDLPTFTEIAAIEHEAGVPVLTSNQTILWQALRTCGVGDPAEGLGRLFSI